MSMSEILISMSGMSGIT
ncbi:Protein CBG25992 [Caenorhabditis briggsae]|uniref:Protein CBG25992 n=1 Tax=Caenorhabditis briggsae TaxID=6238 RepID=B6IKU2_CAEBR|nr:Protein CBG25992 [Caenorhabditis briggsae]CAS00522.1 Protein CBG25992 [Caenorhabditis briggsae]